MKRIIFLVTHCLFALIAIAQEELHIHHINIENGDATLIGIYDVVSQTYTSKILIDGGQSSADKMLLPYIQAMVGSDSESSHFEYIILTHYHNDHYTGLLALQDGRITADSIIDPGGYKVNTIFTHNANTGPPRSSLHIAHPWLNALQTAAHHTPVPFVKGRSTTMIRFSSGSTTSIGNTITLGSIGSNKVQLQCIAGWGNTLSSSNEIIRNPSPTKSNANNFTLAFILTYGQFRYFIGGDMGGENGGDYINQETTVTKYLEEAFPVAVSLTGATSVSGHLCGFKANHHGSDHSNTADFIENMHPAIVITSAGNNERWHLPHPNYLRRLAHITPLSHSATLPDSTFNEGIYFTNLYNFSAASSKTTANTLFKNKPGISYNFGNNTTSAKGSYLIKVTDEDIAIENKSTFEVGRVDINKTIPYIRLALFSCHTK